MRKLRVLVATSAAVAIVAAAASMGGAGAATTNGVGTGTAATSLLRLALGNGGSVLSVRLIGDESKSLTDTKVGTPSAYSTLARLNVASTTAPALNASVPGVEARSPGGSPSVTTPAVNLATPVSTGTISPATLTATLDNTGAKAGLTSQVSNLSLVGGLLAMPNATSNLTTDSLGTNSDGVRGVKIDQITVLDLGALLKLLGIDLAALPTSVLSNLIGTLGLTVPGLASGTDLSTAVGQLNGAITQVTTLVSNATGTTVGSTAASAVSSILGSLGSGTTIAAPAASDPVAALTTTLNDLKSSLSSLLGNALSALDGTALLSVSGIEAGLTTKAADTVANSVATVTAKIGTLKVGNVSLPGIDLGATAAQVSQLVDSVTGKVSAALGAVNPALANLVSLKVLDQNKSVSANNGYTHAVAGLTVLTATIQAPANLSAIVSAVTAPASSVATQITSLGGSVPALSTATNALATTLTTALNGVSALAGGAELRVAELSSTSDFAPQPAAATPSSGGELPRTGQDTAPFAVFGILALALAVALVRWLRRPLPTD